MTSAGDGGRRGDESRPADSRPPHGWPRAPSLTRAERDALRRALERGYFDVPRVTTLGALATEMDRSDVEVSALLRRGVATVLRTTDVLEAGRPPADRPTDAPPVDPPDE